MNIHQYPGDIFYASREFSDEEARDLLRFPCWVFVKNSSGKIVKHIGYNKDGEKAFIQYGEGSGSNITHTHQLINDGEAESPVDKFARESQVSNKLDKPSPSTTQDIIYLVRRKLESEPDYLPVTLNAQRVPVWTGYTFLNSPLYIGTMNSTVGINKSNPSEALDVFGNVRADIFMYNVTTANTVPNKDWTDGTWRFFTDKDGVNHRLIYTEAYSAIAIDSILTGTVTIPRKTEVVLKSILTNANVFAIALETALQNEVNEYILIFKTSSTAPIITMPSGVVWRAKSPTILTNETWTLVFERIWNGTAYETYGTAIKNGV